MVPFASLPSFVSVVEESEPASLDVPLAPSFVVSIPESDEHPVKEMRIANIDNHANVRIVDTYYKNKSIEMKTAQPRAFSLFSIATDYDTLMRKP